MTKFEVNGTTYTISDISLEHYYKLQHNFIVNDNTAAYRLISVLTDCPEEVLKTLPYRNFLEVLNAIQEKIHESLTPEPGFTKTIVLGNTEFTLVNPDDMTIGEFLDLDIILNMPDSENRIHEALAILYRPDGESYDNKISNARHDLFKTCSLLIARQTMNFFLDSATQSLKRMLDSSMEALKGSLSQKNMDDLNHLIYESLGLGTTQSLYSPEKIPWKSIEPHNFPLEEPSISSHGDTTDKKKKREDIINFLKNSKN